MIVKDNDTPKIVTKFIDQLWQGEGDATGDPTELENYLTKGFNDPKQAQWLAWFDMGELQVHPNFYDDDLEQVHELAEAYAAGHKSYLCLNCGKKMIAKRPAKTCSTTCRVAYHRRAG
ncbi:hypothetical protein [Ruegeria sp. HKCCA4633]|uniref:hypothetical protein n=1 Tax=Ruegeria sp. HKCCA4633 TaxID=2682983 RepID=UPI0014882022|nr:hypothetical protein [Ruegeria sp. HKCCA4633]